MEIMDIGTPEKEKKIQPQKQSFLQTLFGTLFGGSGPDAENRKRIKAIAKVFSKTRYHNFYKASSSEILPPFAKLFYDIYKIIAPTQMAFKNIQNKNLIKHQIISYSLSEKQSELLEHLSEEKIQEMSKKIPLEKIRSQIEEDFEAFSQGFDSQRVFLIESTFKAYTALYDFCMFDYYFMLKKFSSKIQEYSFNVVPAFEKITADYILDDLKDFSTILYSIPGDLYWDNLFNMFKERNMTSLNQNTWRKVLSKMKSIQASNALEMIVQIASKDPKYRVRIVEHTETIVDTYLEKLESEVFSTINKLEDEQRSSKASNISSQIFGEGAVQVLKNYTEASNAIFQKKELDLFEYTESLNYIAAFLTQFVKKDLQEYYDIVLIRGQWDTSVAQPMSQAFQNLLGLISKIEDLDSSLAEEGTMGMKIKNLLPQMSHDPGAENIVNRVISDSNELAKEYITEGTKDLITIGKMIKQLIDDHQSKKPVIVQNWKELEKFGEKPLKVFEVEIYKKIYYFVQLMQTCMRNS